MQAVWIIVGNVLESVAQYQVQLLLQQHEEMLEGSQLQGGKEKEPILEGGGSAVQS